MKSRDWLPLPLTFTDRQAYKFQEAFPDFDDCRISRRGRHLCILTDSETHKDIQLQDHSSAAHWRRLDTDLTSAACFELSKQAMFTLSEWKRDFAEIRTFGRKAFQSMMLIELMDDQMQLVFPSQPDEKRTLGMFTGNKLPGMGSARYFEFKIVLKLLKLSADYGIEFEFDLLEGHQGSSALRFHCVGLPFKASITIPLLLSVKGNPVEITRTI